MKLESLTPMLWTREFEKSIQFYTTILGFTCVNRDDTTQWAILKRDQIRIMITVPNQHSSFKKPVFTGSLYMRTDDVDALWEEFKDKAPIVYPIESFDYGMREFAIYDNNGYMIQWAQELKH